MADEFDPLKQSNNKPSQDLYAKIQRVTSNHDDDDLLRPQFENILTTEQKQTNSSTQQQFKENTYERLNFMNNAPKALVRSTNPFADDVQKIQSSTSASPQVEQDTRTFRNQQETEESNIYTENNNYRQYDIGPPPAYYPEEYDEDDSSYRRRGFAAAIDRLVQRFPILGIFYKQPPETANKRYGLGGEQEYDDDDPLDDGDEPPQLIGANQSTSRELTADELSLQERYANKSRTQIINLQQKDETQPIGVCIQQDTYTIYTCDVGRSVIEIFDMYGKLLHVINDPITLKFRPTGIAIAFDGTIIVASHLYHRLQMYSPVDAQDNQNAHDDYQFQQFKLGSPGQAIHQFNRPAGVSIDCNDGYLYICDQGNFRIQVMRPEGICERVMELMLQNREKTSIAPIQLAHQKNGDKIVCIVGVGDAICFIPKYADGQVYVDPLYIVDSDGLGIDGASGIAIDSNDRIFIADTKHHRIVICAPDGCYIAHFGVEGNGPGELKRPCGIDITNDGTIVVADSGNKRLQLFGSVREQTLDENKNSNKKNDNKDDLLILTDPTI